MRPAENIETARLLLRKPAEPGDARAVFAAYSSDPRVTEYLTWRPHYRLEDAELSLRLRLENWELATEFSWAIVCKAKSALIGMVCTTMETEPEEFSLGFVLCHAQRGMGYAPEAAGAVLAAMFQLPRVNSIRAVVDEANYASMRVLEKIGMQRGAFLPASSLHPALSARPRNCWSYAKARAARGGGPH